LGAPGKKEVSKPKYEYKKDNLVRISLINEHRIYAETEASELLVLPLDVPSYESSSKWIAAQIQYDESDVSLPSVPFVLIAEDISGKIIAEFRKSIELKTCIVP
jgi:hypothetical protein